MHPRHYLVLMLLSLLAIQWKANVNPRAGSRLQYIIMYLQRILEAASDEVRAGLAGKWDKSRHGKDRVKHKDKDRKRKLSRTKDRDDKHRNAGQDKRLHKSVSRRVGQCSVGPGATVALLESSGKVECATGISL